MHAITTGQSGVSTEQEGRSLQSVQFCGANPQILRFVFGIVHFDFPMSELLQ
jgi:hypothetical protein